MLKLMFCLHRLPHLSVEEFQDYWYNQHGPLVRSVAALGPRLSEIARLGFTKCIMPSHARGAVKAPPGAFPP